ncbi:restriction endonuclease subunit S [Marinobacterium marinum]|uniref:Restriction endonuclease subunit S n=1 Tax=Marinobacterium marinum TaxID=2756129 RepID=A0A7W2AC54_9GAMM|nr:restriction endonuclease subunit S [Marinobacterium marinum]MBA4502124.1 restriction endonuclease subunit S [Marinobacterium marinum]
MSDVKGFTNTASAGCAGAVNAVPEGWDVVPLSEFCLGIRGVSYKPEDLSPTKTDNTVTLLRSNNIQSGSLYLSDVQHVDQTKVSNKQIANEGDIAVCMSNGSKRLVGKSAAFDVIPNGNRLTVGAFCSIFRPLESVSARFVEQIFNSDQFQRQVDFSLAGSAINNLKNSDVVEYQFAKPPLPEQQKIAAILSSVDDVIEKTRAQIDKLKDLKTGMMQELLTKGIGPDGKPHTEFKDSPVGRIPVSWEVCTLGEITKDSAFGPRFSSDFYSETGNFGCIRTTDINENWDIDYSTVPLAQLNFNEFQSHILRDGDLLVTRSGTCGVVDVFQEQPLPMIAAAFLIRFRLLDSVNPWFVRSVMMSTSTQESIQMLASGGVQKNLSGTNLKTLPLPLPSKEEQDQIVCCINSVSKKIAVIEKRKDLLTSLKKALMQDLLTGKVRVNVEDKEVAVG